MKTFLLMIAGAALACASQTWTGTISDDMCGAKHNTMAEHGTKNISDRECTLKCVKTGGKYVFVTQGKVYNISNQDFAGLEKHAGDKVALTGDMSGDTIKVATVKASGT